MSESQSDNPFGKFTGPSAPVPVEQTAAYKEWEANDDPFKGPPPETARGLGAQTKDAETDWDAIKADWKTGQYTQGQLAKIYGIKREALAKRIQRAKAKGDNSWDQDQQARVAAVAASMLEDGGGMVDDTKQRLAVETAAEMRVRVVKEHRRDISRLRSIANKLIMRLENHLDNKPTDGPLFGAGSKESPTDIVKKLSDAFKHIIPLERVSVGLDDGAIDENKPKGGIVYMPSRKPLPAIEKAGLSGITVLPNDEETEEATDGSSSSN